MRDFLLWAGLAVLATGVALWAWRRFAPVSFWYVLGFWIKAVTVYGTWRAVASGCGLSRRRRRWRWTLPDVFGFGGGE
ncbi:hypothetical protein AB0J35_44975 [Nonomuraea angiospora]|uniref:hypothetical protein n=1 Tax=Nonomuraea angiospora TaxID=46172 RepID=UPI003416A8E0